MRFSVNGLFGGSRAISHLTALSFVKMPHNMSMPLPFVTIPALNCFHLFQVICSSICASFHLLSQGTLMFMTSGNVNSSHDLLLSSIGHSHHHSSLSLQADHLILISSTFQIDGILRVDPRPSKSLDQVIQMTRFNGLIVRGNGTIDGGGPLMWGKTSTRPHLLQLSQSTNIEVTGITIM